MGNRIDGSLATVANKVIDLLAGCLLSIKWWSTKRYKQDTCGIVQRDRTNSSMSKHGN